MEKKEKKKKGKNGGNKNQKKKILPVSIIKGFVLLWWTPYAAINIELLHLSWKLSLVTDAARKQNHCDSTYAIP